MKRIIFLLMLFNTAYGQTLYFDGHFNTGYPSGFTRHTSGLGDGDSAMVLVASPSISGDAIASILPSNDSSGAFFPRAEGLVVGDSTTPNEYFGFDVNFGDWVYDTRNGIFFQCYQYDFPVFAGWWQGSGGKSYLRITRQVDTVESEGVFHSPPITNEVFDTLTFMQVPINTWLRLDFKCNWQADHTGWIEMYVNRQYFAKFTGANMNKTFSDINKKIPNVRIGNYGFAFKGTPYPLVIRRTYFENVTVGRSSQISWLAYMGWDAPAPPAVAPKFLLLNYQAVKVN